MPTPILQASYSTGFQFLPVYNQLKPKFDKNNNGKIELNDLKANSYNLQDAYMKEVKRHGLTSEAAKLHQQFDILDMMIDQYQKLDNDKSGSLESKELGLLEKLGEQFKTFGEVKAWLKSTIIVG